MADVASLTTGLAAAVVVAVPVIGVAWHRLRNRPKAAPAPQAGGASTIADQISQKRQAMERLRSDLGNFGTAIGVTSGGLIAIGTLTKIQDLFPLPAGSAGLLAAGLCLVGLVLSIVASAVLTTLFFRARRQVLVDSDHELEVRPPNVNDKQAKQVRAFFAGSMTATEHALVRSRLPDPTAEPAKGADPAAVQAFEDRTRLGLVDGVMCVLESRSASVYQAPATLVLACVASLGVAMLFGAADWAAGDRARVTQWTSCVSAVGEDLASRCDPLDPLTYPAEGRSPSVGAVTPTPGATSTAR